MKLRYFSQRKCLEKTIFLKKLDLNEILLVLSGKMEFLFPKNRVFIFSPSKDDISPSSVYIYITANVKDWVICIFSGYYA